MRKDIYVHGFVIAIGPENNPNYFTGCGYSCFINEAKVFRTPQGGMGATRIWQYADYGKALPLAWYDGRRAVGVGLHRIEQ